jgi:ribonuclease HI
MYASLPRISLFTRPSGEGNSAQRSLKRWSFRLAGDDGKVHLEATDFESDVSLERLGLLAVVRGLEALDQPSHVTLMNPSRVVSRGLRYGLELWRETKWHWERFGQMTLIRNADLWKRVDAAMAFHQLECRKIRVESAHQWPKRPYFAARNRTRSAQTVETQLV